MKQAPPKPDPNTFGGAHLSERHREVLREAMRLIAERGYRGASLRELARRVGMQQPSLYHYFKSKDELVEQILVTFGFGGVGATPTHGALPEKLEDYPALLVAIVRWLYDHTDWAHFVRLMFNLAIEAPKYQPRLRALLVDTTREQMRLVTDYYVQSGQIDEHTAELYTRMVLSAVALPLIEERLLFPRAGNHHELDDYLAFVVRFASAGAAGLGDAGRARVTLPKVGSAFAEKNAVPMLDGEAPIKARSKPRSTDRRTRASRPSRRR